LLDTENVRIEFTPDGVKQLAGIAYSVNETTENIGARRLYTVMENYWKKFLLMPMKTLAAL